LRNPPRGRCRCPPPPPPVLTLVGSLGFM
jgi:hypothetical protein